MQTWREESFGIHRTLQVFCLPAIWNGSAGSSFPGAIGPAQAGDVKAAKAQANEAEAELTRRIATAQAARDWVMLMVAQANLELIALALALGHRGSSSLWTAGCRVVSALGGIGRPAGCAVDLAIAELQANRTDDALREVDRSLDRDAKDERAFLVRGRALVKKAGDYTEGGGGV